MTQQSKPIEESRIHQAPVEIPGAKKKKGSTLWGALKAKPAITISLLFVLALFLGLITGYGIIGGGSILDVFNLDTWTHVYKLVFG